MRHKTSKLLIDWAIVAAFFGTIIINAPYLYTAGARMTHQLGKILWLIPIDEATIITIPYGTMKPMLLGIYLIAFAGMLGIVSVFATIFEGLKEDSSNSLLNSQQKRQLSPFM
jgi:hypothetical protein